MFPWHNKGNGMANVFLNCGVHKGVIKAKKKLLVFPLLQKEPDWNIYLFETTFSENKLLEHFKCLVKERNYLYTLTQREIGKLQTSTKHASTAHVRMEYKQGREDLVS